MQTYGDAVKEKKKESLYNFLSFFSALPTSKQAGREATVYDYTMSVWLLWRLL